jgi:hypothetical protein
LANPKELNIFPISNSFLISKVLDDRESEALSADTITYSKSNFPIDNKLEIKSKVIVINSVF